MWGFIISFVLNLQIPDYNMYFYDFPTAQVACTNNGGAYLVFAMCLIFYYLACIILFLQCSRRVGMSSSFQ